jgi:hypothetical protein
VNTITLRHFALLTVATMSLVVLSAVAVEKLPFTENGTKKDDQKCIAGQRKSFIRHPGAIYFSTIS